MSNQPLPPPEVPYSALLGQVVKQARVERRVSQAAMATSLGLSQSAYSRLETGDSTFNVLQLRQCAMALGVLPSLLLQSVEAFEAQLCSQGVGIMEEKKANPAAALLGIGVLLALLSRSS
jgi:transcriptional regulator with XRE-family HTH domain